jgi:drug/metabolite transporter (DMT)-like permease
MKENLVRFFAGLASGFGFYVGAMIIALAWQTSTTKDALLKTAIQLPVSLVIGSLLYFGVYSLVNKKREAAISKRITRYATLGIIAGLVIAFFFGMLFYNPTTIGPEPLFPIKPLFPLD